MERRQKSHDAQGAVDEWLALYAEKVPPMLGENEKTIALVAVDLKVDHKTAKKFLEQWEKEGIVTRLGLRRIGRGSAVMAWKVSTP